MATNTFEVFYLGVEADIDTYERNWSAENANSLVGQVFGSSGTPLYENIKSLTVNDINNDGAISENDNGQVNEDLTFGGVNSALDCVVIYNVRLTYSDGTTANATMLLLQDVSGRTFLTPRQEGSPENAVLNDKPIVSITLTSVLSDNYSGVVVNLEKDAFIDGVVTGTSGNDNIGTSHTDADGTKMNAYGGNDTVDAGTGNDTINAGIGNDVIYAGTGADSVIGGTGNDSVSGGDGNDTLSGGDGMDTLFGGAGADYIDGGIGADRIDGGEGSDVIKLTDGFGADTIAGGEGGSYFDTLDLSAMTAGVAVTYTGTGGESGTVASGADSATFSEIEKVAFTGQADTIDASAVTSSMGIDAGSGDDVVAGGLGNDKIQGGSGSDTLSGGGGSDLILGSAGADDIRGGDGNDTIDGGADGDTIRGGHGNDSLTGGDGADRFEFSAGDGADTISDFNTGNTGTLNDGNNTNNDFIDLSDYYDNLSELYADQADDGLLNQSNATDTKGRIIDYSDNDRFGSGSILVQGASADNSSFTVENTGVVCFTTGTAILTPRGEVLIEDLRIGDLVTTMDNGPQPIFWIGRRTIGPQELLVAPNLRPVLIKKGVLGAKRDLLVSQQHGMLIGKGQSWLGRAVHLAEHLRGVRIADGKHNVTYVHLLFEAHQIIFAENTPSESFYPGPMALRMLGAAQRAEMREQFPQISHMLCTAGGKTNPYGQTARDFLAKRHMSFLDGCRAEPAMA